MKLSALISAIGTGLETIIPEPGHAGADPDIVSIHYRSGDVAPGGLFIALKGAHVDGHRFAEEAAAKGAVAVLASEPVKIPAPVVTVRAADTRRAMAAVSAAFYNRPSENMIMIGITGTNGKTTTAFLIEHLLAAAGLSVGVIGTINYRYCGRVYKNSLTTPESLDVQRILADMRGAGVTHVVMEVSSHAVALDRIAECFFDIGVFTNLTQDHLDFHKDMAAYWACKKRFFTDHLRKGPKRDRARAVINANDPKGEELIASLASMPVIPVGGSPSDGVHAHQARMDQTGISANVSSPLGDLAIKSRLVGRFNLDNILCAVGVGAAMALAPADIETAVASFETVPGRLERVADPRGRHVFVDYAHTPDALANVLSTLKEIMPGRLICIFGCGGDRDKTKRPLMGATAARWSDLAIVTSDNPRSESPAAIIADILPGVRAGLARSYLPADIENGFCDAGFVVEPDRAAAIRLGIRAALAGDTVLIAGKGHEPYQILADRVIAFDDREKAAAAIADSCKAPIPWTTEDILAATNGEIFGEGAGKSRAAAGGRSGSDRFFERVFIDSREIPENGLFLAIKGERHDGHGFIGRVLAAGVKGVVIDRHKAGEIVNGWDAARDVSNRSETARDVLVIGVEDTTRALGDLAAYHRRRAGIPVAAITGSNGKTSTKEMIAAVFRQKFITLSTAGNFNNEIGLPLTLLKLDYSHQAAVVEMGMNHPGELRRLSRIGAPDLAVITNIGAAHLQGLGTLEAVMHAKAEITAGMADDAPLILNGDDPWCRRLAELSTRPKVFFGRGDDAHARAVEVEASGTGSRFTLCLPEDQIRVELKVPGLFMVQNALAAAAAGSIMGLTPSQIKAGLESFTAVKGRMNLVETGWGGTLIDDTYNANPDSMAAAIRTLVSLRKSGRAVLVAGDMLELGEKAADYHEQIGRLCGDLGVERVYATGRYATALSAGARRAGMPEDSVITGEKEDLTASLAGFLASGDWVLIKGSRSMGMETIVNALSKNAASGGIAQKTGT
jgi:MurE/MurF fusion protein